MHSCTLVKVEYTSAQSFVPYFDANLKYLGYHLINNSLSLAFYHYSLGFFLFFFFFKLYIYIFYFTSIAMVWAHAVQKSSRIIIKYECLLEKTA